MFDLNTEQQQRSRQNWDRLVLLLGQKSTRDVQKQFNQSRLNLKKPDFYCYLLCFLCVVAGGGLDPDRVSACSCSRVSIVRVLGWTNRTEDDLILGAKVKNSSDEGAKAEPVFHHVQRTNRILPLNLCSRGSGGRWHHETQGQHDCSGAGGHAKTRGRYIMTVEFQWKRPLSASLVKKLSFLVSFTLQTTSPVLQSESCRWAKCWLT